MASRRTTRTALILVAVSVVGSSAGTAAQDGVITRESVRLAVKNTLAAVDGVPKRVAAGQSDWSGVRDLEGEQIILTLRGSLPGTRYVVHGTVNDTGFVALNLTDPAIPAEVRDALASAAWWHPEYFSTAQQGSSFRVNTHLRLEAGSVFLDDRKVLELSQVIEAVPRNRVAEIRLVHRAIKRGIAWGALAGGLAGLGIMFGSCGTHWSESSGCGNLTGLWLLLGPGMGIGIGSGVGATYTITTVVYRAP